MREADGDTGPVESDTRGFKSQLGHLLPRDLRQGQAWWAVPAPATWNSHTPVTRLLQRVKAMSLKCMGTGDT